MIKFKQQETMDGAGVKIKRIHDFYGLKMDPFLMIDELKSDNKNDFISDFPEHPHRGLETFTYFKEGGFIHKDKLGNEKPISAGGTQWMKAGSGMLHSEMPLSDDMNSMHGFQIWINMPSNKKMDKPEYKDNNHVGNKSIKDNDSEFIILNGEWNYENNDYNFNHYEMSGNAGIADLILSANTEKIIKIKEEENIGALIYEESISGIGVKGEFFILEQSRKEIKIKSEENGAKVLIFKGIPIKEKVVHHGPFVMNTNEEIRQAMIDFSNGYFDNINNYY